MSLVLCKLPKAGLGNQLFPLMKGYVFGNLNNLPVKVKGYNQFLIGPYLRGDKSKRNYAGYFTFQKGMLRQKIDDWKLFKYREFEIENEPPLTKNEGVPEGKIYSFDKLPHWSDYFYGLKDHRELVLRLFNNLISQDIKNKVAQLTPPIIGVHVRMGDFKKLRPGDDFSKLGVVRTPQEYYVNVINQARKLHGSELPVSVFTDGHKHELKLLLSLKNIKVVEGNPDIVDLLLLSKSKIIITSAGSTFSYWAGFLSDVPLIMHPDHIYESIRPTSLGQEMYEGDFDLDQPLLVASIKSIK